MKFDLEFCFSFFFNGQKIWQKYVLVEKIIFLRAEIFLGGGKSLVFFWSLKFNLNSKKSYLVGELLFL